MLPMYRELFGHQEWADRALLVAVRAHPGAADDEEMRKVLHHIVMVQRAFTAMVWGLPFDREKESKMPATFDALEEIFRQTHADEAARVGALAGSEMERVVEVPMMRGMKFTVAQGLMQMVMHSHAHRAQCLTRLRVLGAKPPILDYILWVKEQAEAERKV